MRSRLLVGGALALGLGLAQAAPREGHLEDPATLPQAARMLLRTRMAHHAADMRALTDAIVLLDYDAAGEVARRVAAEPQLARPLSHDATELNSRLPKRFFELQDQLMRSAHLVEVAASAHDADALSSAASQLSATCVACHATYRTAR